MNIFTGSGRPRACRGQEAEGSRLDQPRKASQSLVEPNDHQWAMALPKGRSLADLTAAKSANGAPGSVSLLISRKLRTAVGSVARVDDSSPAQAVICSSANCVLSRTQASVAPRDT